MKAVPGSPVPRGDRDRLLPRRYRPAQAYLRPGVHRTRHPPDAPRRRHHASHRRVDRPAGPQPALTVYTAQLQAKPFAISDAPLDTLIGFDPTGAMCIRADSGAVRVEQQLTAQSIVVPQSGEVLITNGQLESLRSGVTHCSCALQLAKTLKPTPSTEVSRLPTPEEMQKANAEAAARMS